MSATEPKAERVGLYDQIAGLDNRFWIVNVMEMFERLAYYGVRTVIAIYMVLALEKGGPEFTHVQKGTIYAVWAFVQSMLPVFTGGFADRYGHKKTIFIAIIIKIIGYLMMAFFKDFYLFGAGCVLLAAGTAIFKPGVQGTMAATLKDSNASVGWGLFYQLVNVGGFLGPVIAGILRLLAWKYVFIACAVIVAVNFLWLPFYQDPTHDEDAVDDAGQRKNWANLSQAVTARWASIVTGAWVLALAAAIYFTVTAYSDQNVFMIFICVVFLGSMALYVLRKDLLDEGRTDPLSVFLVSVAGMFQHRVLWFCVVFSGFWFMFNQVFDLLPNVIDDWVDSSGIIATFGAAFSSPTVPTVLSIGLGLVFGGLCAAIVLLAMRPDQREARAIPTPAFAVVGIGFAMASFPLWVLTDLPMPAGLACLFGLLFAVASANARPPGKILAIAALLLGGGSAILAIRQSLIASAAELTAMAERGAQVPPEWMININPGLIVFTMIGFAYLSGFVRPMVSILLGMMVATVGSILAGTASVGWFCLGGIAVFSVGEMLSSPKMMEYLASLARKGQEGLFMGYANVPLAIGWVAGSILAGNAYEERGDKVNLAKRHLEEVVGMSKGAVEALQKTDVLPTLATKLNLSTLEVQRLLFDTYHPDHLWYGIGVIGAASILGMIAYDRVIRFYDARSPSET